MKLIEFLKPTWIKLALLAPGIGFLLLELLIEPGAVVDAAPGLLIWGLLFYLLASVVIFLRSSYVLSWSFSRLLIIAVLLAVLDQVIKLNILRWMPLGAELPVIPHTVSLSHVHNTHGSWLSAQFGWNFLGFPVLIFLTLTTGLITISIYRYYEVRNNPRSLWADIVLVGLVAGMVSSFVDLAIRGFTVDYLSFSGLVVADLKDFYINFALAAFFAELVENYTTARKMGVRETIQYLAKALQFNAQEIKEYFSARGLPKE